MTRIMLDTSGYSTFLRGDRELEHTLRTVDEICVNPIVLGELLGGFTQGKHESKNRRELRDFLSSPRVNILAIDEETSERYAVILKALRDRGTPIPTNDIWIAASAMQYGLRIITTDSHFNNVPQVIVGLDGSTG